MLQASLPSYGLSIAEDPITNAKASSEEVLFQVNRLKAEYAHNDKMKIDTVL